jgi:glycosyltransferase involved in cell wall biosynthesis
MPAPNLLQIVPGLAGGIGRATLDAVRAIVAGGGAAAVVSPGGPMLPDLLRLRARHLELPVGRAALLRRLDLPRRISAAMQGFDVEVVQARSPAATWIAGAVARRLGVGWIATLHRPLLGGGLLASHAERRQAGADLLIAVSEHVAQDMRRRFPTLADKLDVVPPGVDLDRFDPARIDAGRVVALAAKLRLPDGAHIVLCPGRFVEDHGQETLIEAIRTLARPDLFCLLLGSTDAPTAFEKELERMIERAGLQSRVQIGPHVEDMPAAYMLADTVVATGGRRRGYGRTMIEAQAMGRPTVCETGGGAAEVVLEGRTGWLAPEGDPAALARAIATALSLSAERRAELARAGRDNVRARFGLAEANARLLQLQERLCRRRTAGPT